MNGESGFLEFAAGVFGVPPAAVSMETAYGSISEWDSMAQLRLVMEIAERYGTEIPFADVPKIASLWEFWRRIRRLPPKKAIAVDLDNTLWDGVVGEDGIDGIRPNLPLLRQLKDLRNRGVLLAVLSKNNEEDGLSGLDSLARSGSPLARDDFVGWRIDWNEKADNLLSLAQELNLGTDAFVFVDDNPAERLKMQALLPEVAVAQFPPNVAAYFPESEVTDEDLRKTEEYRAESRRRQFLGDGGGLAPDEVFRRLGVSVDVHEMSADEAVRVAQLSQKANQYNACTNRRTADELPAAGKDGAIVVCRAADNFGDHGLIAFAIVRGDGSGGAEISDWVMSCRVAGRGIEARFMAATEDLLRRKGIRTLRASWRASGKNLPVRGLFGDLGFSLVRETPDERIYRKTL